jgi:hypothetical protein
MKTEHFLVLHPQLNNIILKESKKYKSDIVGVYENKDDYYPKYYKGVKVPIGWTKEELINQFESLVNHQTFGVGSKVYLNLEKNINPKNIFQKYKHYIDEWGSFFDNRVASVKSSFSQIFNGELFVTYKLIFDDVKTKIPTDLSFKSNEVFLINNNENKFDVDLGLFNSGLGLWRRTSRSN